MDNKETKSAATTPKTPLNATLAEAAGVLESMRFVDTLADFLGDAACRNIIAFSGACKDARAISADYRKKALLLAVVNGNEALAKGLITSRPELLLDKSATVKDISGKEIKNLTPLQAAICAGDVEMVQMIVDVLNQKQQSQTKLSFNPEQEIQNQFAEIYPNSIDAVEAVQKAAAQTFRTTKLAPIFTTINAATNEQIQFELNTPGLHKPESQLNVALHNFRAQVTVTSNQELIFNPYYLLAAFEFYDAQLANFNGDENTQWYKKDLFWRQVIGFVQRHLPACYLQAFAQGIYNIVEHHEKLKRDFKFKYDKGYFMRPAVDGLGYKYAGGLLRGCGSAPLWDGDWRGPVLQKLLRTKAEGFQNLFTRQSPWQQPQHYLQSRCVIS